MNKEKLNEYKKDCFAYIDIKYEKLGSKRFPMVNCMILHTNVKNCNGCSFYRSIKEDCKK